MNKFSRLAIKNKVGDEMTKEDIIEAIRKRIEILDESLDPHNHDKGFIASRVDELESLLEHIENPRIK